MDDVRLKLRKLWGAIARRLFLGYGWCGRCKRPWAMCRHHSTRYAHNLSCFALCEECWSELTPRDRLPYYKQVWERWYQEDPLRVSGWILIKLAVILGK